ncbi:hypothetical protein HNP40_000212 [Mycobacteroides chelonae]|nr:hypothetical protein [Mycobacteroides chelonae]
MRTRRSPSNSAPESSCPCRCRSWWPGEVCSAGHPIIRYPLGVLSMHGVH